MCYTVNNNNSAKKVGDKLKKPVSDKQVKMSNFMTGFAHPSMYIVKQESPDFVDVAKWGLVPSFISDETKAKDYFVNTLNAKAETIFEKVSFKKSILPRRCIIPVSGFFEWRDINKAKYPYYIGVKNEDVFCIGGIYDTWVNKSTGEINTTFSMVTTEANSLMAKIHNLKLRQPLILDSANAERWIKNDLTQGEVIDLMKPMSEDHMKAHTIKKVSPKNVDVFSDEIIGEYEYPELAFYE
jgi:putative SOS response-associated peptidase YedK